MYYAYIYSDPITNVPFYVGKGTGKRAYKHLYSSHNVAMSNKLKKIKDSGLKPFVDLIETSTEEFAFMLEKGLVKQYGRRDIGTGTLFNFTDGGEFTGAKKGRPAPNKGKPCPDVQKQKIAVTLKGYMAGVPQPRLSCIYCKKEGGFPVMSRHHMNNCKEKTWL